jgi:hypothetical protein
VRQKQRLKNTAVSPPAHYTPFRTHSSVEENEKGRLTSVSVGAVTVKGSDIAQIYLPLRGLYASPPIHSPISLHSQSVELTAIHKYKILKITFTNRTRNIPSSSHTSKGDRGKARCGVPRTHTRKRTNTPRMGDVLVRLLSKQQRISR